MPLDPPASPKKVSLAVQGGFRYVFSCDFELAILAPIRQKRSPWQVPLAGNWALQITPAQDGGTTLFEIGVEYEDLDVGQIASMGDSRLSFAWVSGNTEGVISSQAWHNEPIPLASEVGDGSACSGEAIDITRANVDAAADASGGAYDPDVHRKYRLKHEISCPQPVAVDPLRLHAHFMHDFSKPSRPVRLFFPHAGASGAELWSDRDFLSAKSPYFAMLFDSQLIESNRITHKDRRARQSSAKAESTATSEFDDSDEETDEILFKKAPPELATHDDDYTFNQITILEAAYSTYRAVLVYLDTNRIAFAPLSSTFSPTDSHESWTRETYIESNLHRDGGVPVSPKAVYRLADLLMLEDLKRQSLAALSRDLDPDCAAVELFADVSACYDEWRKVIVEYVVAQFEAVSKTAHWTEMMGSIRSGERRDVAWIVLEVKEAREQLEVCEAA
ncbi:hypothetical protein JCM10450v2_004948 [Rhodotorula kratochvilovae]